LVWFLPLLARLLEADPATLRLLAHDPFDGERPAWVRARTYRYRFATRAEHATTGQVWVREDLGLMVEPQSLATLARRRGAPAAPGGTTAGARDGGGRGPTRPAWPGRGGPGGGGAYGGGGLRGP